MQCTSCYKSVSLLQYISYWNSVSLLQCISCYQLQDLVIPSESISQWVPVSPYQYRNSAIPACQCQDFIERYHDFKCKLRDFCIPNLFFYYFNMNFKVIRAAFKLLREFTSFLSVSNFSIFFMANWVKIKFIRNAGRSWHLPSLFLPNCNPILHTHASFPNLLRCMYSQIPLSSGICLHRVSMTTEPPLSTGPLR